MTHVAVLFDDFIPQGVPYKIITSFLVSKQHKIQLIGNICP